mgnify:CR=1 FL=1
MSTTSKILQYAANGHPVLKDDFELMQENTFGFMSNIAKFIETDGTFKAWGAVVTEGVSDITWTEGAIFYLGICYQVAAGSIPKTIAFAPFWKVSLESEAPDPVTYEDNTSQEVHKVYTIELLEEPGIGDDGIFDSQLKSLPGPLIDLDFSTGGAGAILPVEFTITNQSSGIISVGSTVINSGDIQLVTSGDDLTITFSRPNNTLGAVMQINNQPFESIFPVSGLTPNTATRTLTGITASTQVKITWWPYTHQFRVYRTNAASTSNSPTYVSRMESYPVENAISYQYLTLGQETATVRVLLLSSIDTSNLAGTGAFVNEYITYGTPTITQFKINGVDKLADLVAGLNLESNNELNKDGSPGGYYYVNSIRYYTYRYLRWAYLLDPIASDIDITLTYTRANDGNGQLPPTGVGPGGGCLLEGTIIDTTDPQEQYKIEDIRVGHELSVMNPLTRQMEKVLVTGKQNYFVNQIYTINGIFTSTGGHQQYIMRNNDYIVCRVDELREGDILFTRDFKEVVIESIEITSSNKDKFLVYNIEVEGEYYIANGIITHNKTLPPPIPIGGDE